MLTTLLTRINTLFFQQLWIISQIWNVLISKLHYFNVLISIILSEGYIEVIDAQFGD